MCIGRIDFDVTTGRLQNQGHFQVIYCNTTDQHFCRICGVEIHTVSKLSGNNVDFLTDP